MNNLENINLQKKLYSMLKRKCLVSAIEGFITEEYCKGCKHIQMVGLMPCNRCSRRVLTKDFYEPR